MTDSARTLTELGEPASADYGTRATLTRAVRLLPRECPVHGWDTAPADPGSESCCWQGIAARRRHLAEIALQRPPYTPSVRRAPHALHTAIST
jgi:hypothetical protein